MPESEYNSEIPIQATLVPVAATDINNSCGQLLYDLVLNLTGDVTKEQVKYLSISMIQWYIYNTSITCPVTTPCCVDKCYVPPPTTEIFNSAIADPSTKTGIITQSTSIQFGKNGQNSIDDGLTVRLVINTSEHQEDPTEWTGDNIFVVVYFSGIYPAVDIPPTPTDKVWTSSLQSASVPVYYPPYAPIIKTVLIDDEDNTLYILVETIEPAKMDQLVAVISYDPNYVPLGESLVKSTNALIGTYTPGLIVTKPLTASKKQEGTCVDAEGNPISTYLYEIKDFTTVKPENLTCNVNGYNVSKHSYVDTLNPGDNIYPKVHQFFNISALGKGSCLGCIDVAPQILSIDYTVYKINPCVPRCSIDCPRPDDQLVILTWEQPCDYFIPPYAAYYNIIITAENKSGSFGPVTIEYPVTLDQRFCPVLNNSSAPIDLMKVLPEAFLTCGTKITFIVQAVYTDGTTSDESEDRWVYYFTHSESPPLKIDHVAYEAPYDTQDKLANVSFTFFNPLPELDGCGSDKEYIYYYSTYFCKNPNGSDDVETYTIPFVAGDAPYVVKDSNIDFSSYSNQTPLLLHLSLQAKTPEQDPRLKINPIPPNTYVHGYPTDADLILDTAVQFNFNRANNSLYLDFSTKVPAKSITIVKYNNENNAEHLTQPVPEPILINGQHEYSIHYDVGKYKPYNGKIGVIIDAPGSKSERNWNWE